MKKINRAIVLFTVIIPLQIHGGEIVSLWPELSQIKYVSGRVATEKDINEGAAVFLLKSEGLSIGSPMKVLIPQYAIHTDGSTGEKSNVIVIQAEEANGQKVVGALIASTKEYMAGLFNEFELLGSKKPGK